MLNHNARAVSPVSSPALCIRTIWQVDGDDSYDIRAGNRPADEIVLLRTMEGTGRLYFRNHRVLTVQPGTVLCFVHNSIMRYHCQSGGWKFWWFEFSDAGFDGFPLISIEKLPSMPGEEALTEECFSLLKKNNPPANRLASSLAQTLVGRYIYFWKTKGPLANPHQEAIDAVIALMQKKPTGLSIEEMAGPHVSVLEGSGRYFAGLPENRRRPFMIRCAWDWPQTCLRPQTIRWRPLPISWGSPANFT
jgi:hypothetical protein